MVRTKQTAKKSTGGKAPRVTLIVRSPCESPQPLKAVPQTSTSGPQVVPPNFLANHRNGDVQARMPEPVPELETHLEGCIVDGSVVRPCLHALHSLGPSDGLFDDNNDFCHLCADGGELWKCNVCVRSECKKCVEIPPESLPVVQHKDVKYLCVSCHLMDNNKAKMVIPYMAFYQDGKPVLPEPPHVVGRFELSPKSVMHTPITAIIHVYLKDHISTKGPVNMLRDFLHPHFVRTGGLVAADVPFDLGTEGKRKAHLKKATKIVERILAISPSRVIFILTTHTDEDRGDFFAGIDGGKPMSAEIQQFFEIVFDPLKAITQNAILYVLSCGQYIRHSATRGDFTKAIARLGFMATVAFDARRFHPTVAWAFLITLTELVILQGHSFADAVPVALGNSNDLNRHSGVYVLLLSPDHKFIHTTRYLWAHRDYRPWGKDIPVQCPSCGAAQEKWKRTSIPGGCRFRCKNPDCLSDKQHKTRGPFYLDVKKPKGLTVLPHGKSQAAAWTTKRLRATPVETPRT